MKDDFGDRMKEYESAEAKRRFLRGLPVVARIDGKRFSRFTADLARPYDERLSRLMVATTRHLVEETAAMAGYTQSDEISLLYHQVDEKSQMFLDRRVQKMTSILTSIATAFFNSRLPAHIDEKAGEVALFDGRVWAVPSKVEAANTFLWRESDATKNSVSMAARVYYPHDAIEDRTMSEMHEMLFRKGVNWNDYPAFFKRGTFVLRRTVFRRFESSEIESLPPLHAARTNPELTIARSEVRPVEMPPFGRVKNRVDVLFNGAEPICATE